MPGTHVTNPFVTSLPNHLLYNGKELQDEISGLRWYDYQTRYYDPLIVRTPTMDPHAESYCELSPYSFLKNNPLRNIDPSGMDVIDNGDRYTITGADVWFYLSMLQSGTSASTMQQAAAKASQNDANGHHFDGTIDDTEVTPYSSSPYAYLWSDANSSAKNPYEWTPEELNA
jgi:RHS repeat-associated protein